MTVYELLSGLPADTRKALYQVGGLSISTLNQLDIFEQYVALLSLPRYVDAPADAVRAIVQELGVSRATVYNAIKKMRQEVARPTTL